MPAPLTVAVPATGERVDRGRRLVSLTAVPPAPSMVVEVWPPISIWNDCVAPLNEPSVTCWDSLPPAIALAMPAAVLFWPRTIGTVVAPL